MTRTRHRSDAGFSLAESVVAIGILTIGLLSLAAVLTKAVSTGAAASEDLIAKDKAYEAMENIVAARDSKLVHWDDLQNVADGGVFLDGAKPLKGPGTDGIVGTEDDATANAEVLMEPGPDGQLGTSDDISKPLTMFTRQIAIVAQNGSTTLRQITVTVRYTYAGQQRQYQLVSLVSSYN
jgi:type II secretory pathway pseudopilin PulG